MNEHILYARPSSIWPILSRRRFRKGEYYETKTGILNFTDIGKKVYDSAMEFDKGTKIKLVGRKIIALVINWDVEISNDRLQIMVRSRQYYGFWFGPGFPKDTAIKITMFGQNSSINRYLSILRAKFEKYPTDFDNWEKLEKRFNTTRSQVEADWTAVLYY